MDNQNLDNAWLNCGMEEIGLTRLPPQCRIDASVNWVTIGPDNGLSPIRHQAII